MSSYLTLLLFAIGLLTTDAHPQSCTDITLPSLHNVRILSVTREQKAASALPPTPPLQPSPLAVPPICSVTITLTHTGVNDSVTVQVWLPLSGWNGRFVALGGSAWAAGPGPAGLAVSVSAGFAAASTDAGIGFDLSSPASWALKDHEKVNLGLLENFASRSVHDMAALGAGVTKSFYGRRPTRYWNGCSTGGRQGMVAAQRYPELFDGILAGAPAIYWPEYVVAELWPQVIMKEEGVFPSLEEMNAVVKKAIEKCDTLDGAKDGVIAEPEKCGFDPREVVGKTQVGGKEIEITKQIADIVKKIWDGPSVHGKQLWYGLPIGAPFEYLANTTTDGNGTRVGLPFFVADTWIKYFVQKDPGFDSSSIGSKDLQNLFVRSQHEYDGLLHNADPDLSRLKHSGGKLLVWHGAADQIIFPQGTTRYRQTVEKAMGGGGKADSFFRYFLAPGVDHCGLGTTPGAIPSRPFEALIAWVENGTAPEFLEGQTPTSAPSRFSRKICRYPLVARYRGYGNASELESFGCVEDV